MTKELLHGGFNDLFEQFKPGLKTAVHGVLSGDANFEELFDEDDNPIVNSVKDRAEEQLEAIVNQIHVKAKEELIDRFHLSPKDQDAVGDFIEGMQDIMASDAVQDLLNNFTGHEKEAGAIKTVLDTEMNGFVDNLVKHVVKPEFNKKAFLKKSDQLFKDFAIQLHDETDFDTTKVIKPLVQKLRNLTTDFANGPRDKAAVAAYRTAFTAVITEYDATFSAHDKPSNDFFALMYDVLRVITALISQFFPESTQKAMNALFPEVEEKTNGKTFQTAAKNLKRDLSHQAVVDPEEDEEEAKAEEAPASATMH